MITVKSETPVKLESSVPLEQKQIDKLKRVDQAVVKHVLKDLHIHHSIEGCMSSAGIFVDHNNDIEKKIEQLKASHEDFVAWLDNYKIEEEKDRKEEEKADVLSPLEKYKNIIQGIKREAAEEKIGICAFIEDDNQVVYTGFMPDVELAKRTLFLNIANGEF